MKKQFDRFILTDLVEQGAHGALYSGEERLPGNVSRPVTVKLLPPLAKNDPNAERRFVDEVRVLAALAGNPYVVTFYGMGVGEGTPWIATEQPQATLANVLGEGPADPREVARLVEHVARGLSALHALQPPMLHNRLHPGNVLVCAGSHYKITEFGLASPASVEPTLSMQSVRYAAPELLNRDFGPPGPATDLYALGHLAYEMALGGKLHRAQFPAVWEGAQGAKEANPSRWQAWHHSIPTVVPAAHEVVRGFPAGLGNVIARLMAKPLQARYMAAEQVIADVRGSGVAEVVSDFAPVADVGPAMPRQRVGGFQRSAPQPMATPDAAPAMQPRFARTSAAAPMPGAAPGGGGDRYFVRLRNSVTGPFDLATLQRMARQGQLSRMHQVSNDQHAWRSAGTVEGLFG